jgi:hypothetical protein
VIDNLGLELYFEVVPELGLNFDFVVILGIFDKSFIFCFFFSKQKKVVRNSVLFSSLGSFLWYKWVKCAVIRVSLTVFLFITLRCIYHRGGFKK